MAHVQLSSSQALVALHRTQQVAAAGPTIIRWLARIVAGADLILLVVWYTNTIQIPSFVRVLAFITLAFGLVYLVFDLYRRTHWSSLPTLPPLSADLLEKNDLNLANYLDLEAAALVEAAVLVANQPEPNAHNLFQASLKSKTVQPLFVRLGLPLDDRSVGEFSQKLSDTTTALAIGDIIQRATQIAVADQRPLLDVGDIVTAVAGDPTIKALFFDFHIEPEDVAAVAAWQRRLNHFHETTPLYEQPVGAGIAQDWTAGYTPALNQFSSNLSNQVDPLGPPIALGRAKELDELDRYLSKSRGHNVLLVGAPGAGKSTLVAGYAQRLARGNVSTSLSFQQIRIVDIGSLLAGVSARGDLEARLLRVFSEAAQAGNIILYVPDIQALIGGGDRVGGVDATEIFMRILQTPNMHIIASTTPADYQSRIAANPTLAGLMDRMDLSELDKETTLEVLEDSVFHTESETGTLFTYAALRQIVDMADRYLHDQPFPEKALQLMSEVANFASAAKRNWIDAGLVQEAISAKLKMPLRTVQGDERDQLLKLEDELHKSVIGQDEAITAIASALRRARAGLSTGKRPIASLLFLGPTGVGKTESAKSLARVYFGDEERMIRLDMSEYQNDDGLPKLIGSSGAGDGTKSGGYLADAVHDQPFSLVLLDELEKANSQVLNLFLQVLDDGRLTDGAGRLIDFTNTIIIATSNAGAELIRESIAAGEADDLRRQKLIDYLQREHVYRPEFLNRFDGVIAFHPLTIEHVQAIARLMLGALGQRIADQQQIQVGFSGELVAVVAAGGFDAELGARPLRRFIQDHVESWLANQLLSGALARGGSVVVTPEMIGLGLPNAAPPTRQT